MKRIESEAEPNGKQGRQRYISCDISKKKKKKQRKKKKLKRKYKTNKGIRDEEEKREK